MNKDNSKNKERIISGPSTIIIIIIAFALVVGLSFWYMTESVNKKIVASNIDAMEELSLHDLKSIENSIILRWNNMEGVAKDISHIQFESSDELISTLKTRTADIPSATKMSLLTSDGTNYLSNGVVEKNSYLAEICEGKTERFVVRLNTDVHFRENVHEVIFEVVPVDFSVESSHFEWLICQFPISTLENELMISNYNGKGYSSVIDFEGNYIINVSRNHSFMNYDNFFNDLKDAEVDGNVSILELCSTTTTTGANSAIYELNGQKNIMVVTSVDIADWYFISTVPVSVFDTQTRSITSSFLILLAILAVIIAAIFVLLLKQRKQQAELKKKEETDALNAQLQEKQASLEESLAFTDFFLDHYMSVYYVNLEDGSCKVYRRNEELDENYPIQDNFFTSLRAYINKAVHPDSRSELSKTLDPANLKNTLQSTPAFNRTYKGMSSGTERIFRVQVIRGADEDHAAFGFEDVTEAYQEQQKHLLGAIPLSSDVLTKANIGLWSFELDEGCAPRMYADEAMLGLIGLDHQIAPEDTYHAWYDNIDDGAYDLVNDAVEKMVSGEHAEVQYPWHNPNGETWIVRCGGVRNPEYTKGIRIEGTHQNVTTLLHYDEEQRKREEKQRQDELARVQAEASSKAKTEFLFNMSHDIRTPMNAILGYTDIAMNHIDEPDRVGDSLKKIKLSGGHLLNLINDILEMSRIEAGKMEIVTAALNVYEVNEGVVTMSRSLADTKDITFNVKADGLKNPYIFADELHTNQVIINLISNAIKYTNPGGTVDYSIEQISDPVDGFARYRFMVKDNGIGMSEEFQEHLFESFSREQSATVSKQEGAGLGLAIVKKIIDMMNGTIAVQSKLGEGSTFVVELPFKVMDEKAIEEFEASRRKEAVVNDEQSFDGQKVLLVEDNEMNREIATEILEEVGLVIDTAEDGAIAVRKVMEKGTDYYDFILMDIQMPVMDGYEATAEIRKLPGADKIPIIALSANAFKEDMDRSLAAGMNAHVAKPIDVKTLFETMQGLTK